MATDVASRFSLPKFQITASTQAWIVGLQYMDIQ